MPRWRCVNTGLTVQGTYGPQRDLAVRAAKDEPLRKVLRSELSKERATRLEGSFGTQKQHYSLARIKARNRKTEILWIFFGIHTANAILMIDKIRNRTGKAA